MPGFWIDTYVSSGNMKGLRYRRVNRVNQEEQTKQRAEDLNNSRNLDVHKWSEYPEVKNAVDELFQKFLELPDFKGKQNLQKKHIKVIVLDLYVRYKEDAKGYISFYRMKGMYRGKSRYNQLHISFTSVSVIDNLAILGYLEQVKGHHDRTKQRASHMSRMRAKVKLIDFIFKEHKITPEMVERHPHTECVILKDKDENGKKIVVTYTDTAATNAMRTNLNVYNNLLRRTHIDIPWFPAKGVRSRSGNSLIKTDRSNKFTRRIFNNHSWEDGGRYYGGWWQGTPKDWRKKILLDGSRAVEIDYSGLHIVLLYALEGTDYWQTVAEDPYRLEGYEESERMRSLLKQVLLTSINGESKQNALGAIQKEVNFNKDEYQWVIDEGIDLGELIDKFSKTHSPISKYFFSGHGVKLQNLDSNIAEMIVNEFTRREIPVLCIHDSFIVPSQYKDDLLVSMKKAFRKALSNAYPEWKSIVPKVDELMERINIIEAEELQFEDITDDYDTPPSISMTLKGYAGDKYCASLKEHRNNTWDRGYYSSP